MSVNGLYRGFFPKGVAVIGFPDENIGTWGRRIVENLAAGGFKGEIFPVFPYIGEMAGLKTVPNLDAVQGRVDLAFLMGPLSTVPQTLQDCKRTGVGCLMVPGRNYTSLALLKKIYQEARETGVRLFGPRSWGVVNPWVNLNGSLGSRMPHPGGLAVVSQSATFCSSLIDLSLDRKIGLSILVGLGDMLDVDFADAIDYLANHFRVGAILLHVESLTNMRKFMSAARAASRMKPIVALKTGRFHSGARALTGTGSLFTEDGAYDAVFKRAGIIRVETIEDLFDCGALLGKQPRPLGPNLAVMANSRTPGVMAMDALTAGGLPRAVFKFKTIAALDRIIPQGWGENNPITLDPQTPVEVYIQAMEACLTDPELDGLLIIITPEFLSDSENLTRALARAATGKKSPVIVVWMGGRAMGPARTILEEAGVPVYDSPERAVRAFRYLFEFDRNLKMLQEIPPALPAVFAENKERARKIIESRLAGDERMLSGLESLELLRAYDLPVLPADIVRNAEEAVELAREMGGPVTLRLEKAGPGAGSGGPADQACLFDLDEVKSAYDRLVAREGREPGNGGEQVVIQPAFPRPGYLLRLGCRQVNPFGPVILFGQAGLPPEASTDQALGLPPLNRLLARRIIEQTRVCGLLTGEVKDEDKVMDRLTGMLVKLSHLVTDFPEINELEISPVYMVEGSPQIQWARVVLAPSDDPPPMHLIISPYPDEYESRVRTKAGLDIFVRPIRPEDSRLLQELWSILSPRTIYYRFSRPVKELTPSLLVGFTQIDYDREMALVAIMNDENGREKMLAVARLFGQPGALLAEFAVVVGDPWQGKGVGAQLLRKLFIIAAKRRIGKLWGLVLRENVVMLELARKVGCRILKSDDPSQVEVTLEMTEETAAKLLADEA